MPRRKRKIGMYPASRYGSYQAGIDLLSFTYSSEPKLIVLDHDQLKKLNYKLNDYVEWAGLKAGGGNCGKTCNSVQVLVL